MILYNNLEFFNKQGKNLNLTKEYYVTVTINRNDDGESKDKGYKDARVEAITNEFGKVEFFTIIEPGEGYDERMTVTIEDFDTGASYTIDNFEFITLIDDPVSDKKGIISEIVMPQSAANFSFPSFVYTGNIFFEKTSTNLVASEQVYVLEKMLNTSGEYDTEIFSAPRTYNDSEDYSPDTLYAELVGDEYEMRDDAIKLYRVIDDNSDLYPYIDIVNNYAEGLDRCLGVSLENGDNDSFYNGMRETKSRGGSAIVFDLMLLSENEGVFEQRLAISERIGDNSYTYAILTLHGETEGEDERFKLALQNFAININEEELKIFRNSDVNEENPDFRILNQKRKEMLLEYHNIYPYMGTYKGLVNMINFFGFGDTRLKEYWLNVDKSIEMYTKKIRRTQGAGKPIDLTRLHEFAKSYNDSNANAKTIKDPVEPVFKTPMFYENNVDLTELEDGKLEIPIYDSHGELVGVNTVQYDIDTAEVVKREHEIDSAKAAKVVKRSERKEIIEKVPNDELQYAQIDVPMQVSQKSGDELAPVMLPSENWKKTNKFGLFYDINTWSGEYDEHNLPIMVDADMFSEDEVLIKLFGLRNYLKDKFMPVNTRLVDIVGEASYYSRVETKTWKDECTTYTINKDTDLDIKIESKKYIQDLHDYKERSELDREVSIKTYIDYHPNNFSESDSKFKNEEGPVGCPVKMSLILDGLTWDEGDIMWEKLEMTTWDNLRVKDFSDIEWDIKYMPDVTDRRKFGAYDAGQVLLYGNTYKFTSYETIVDVLNKSVVGRIDVDTNLFTFEDIYLKDFYVAETYDTYIKYDFIDDDSFLKDLELTNELGIPLQIGLFGIKEVENEFVQHETDSHETFEVILPYSGKYKIQCTLHDATNAIVSKTIDLDIDMPLPNFAVFGRSIENPLSTWDNSEDTTWDEASAEWRCPASENDLTWDDMRHLRWDDLDFSRYERQSNPFLMGEKGSLITISEEDRYVGKVIEVDGNVVRFEGCFDKPGLEVGDSVYLRFGNMILKEQVIDTLYDKDNNKTTLRLYDTHEMNENWEVLREIGGTVLIKGNMTDLLTKSINEGKYLLFRSNKYDNYKLSNIKVTSPLVSSDDILGIVLDKSVHLIPGEFGRLYERKTLSLSGLIYDDEKKTITFGDNTEKDEIIPGFTVVTMRAELEDGIRDLHLRVNRNIDGNTYSVVELDGDMRQVTEWSKEGYFVTVFWDYHEMTVKVSSHETEGETNELALNLNDYQFNTSFLEDSENFENDDTQFNWMFDYIVKDGSFSIEVKSVEVIDGDTLIYLNDTNRELYQASKRFNVSWSSFDEEYAETRYGTEIFSWENFDESTWDDLSHQTWNMLEYYKAPLCGFEIQQISSGGTIQFNSSNFIHDMEGTNPIKWSKEDMPETNGRFSFTKVRGGDDWETACEELNTTSNEGMSRFDYKVVEYENEIIGKTKKIVATAKGEGIYYLGYLLFGNGTCGELGDENGVSHTYPIGKYADWRKHYECSDTNEDKNIPYNDNDNTLYEYGINNKDAYWNPVSRAYYEYGAKEVYINKYGRVYDLVKGWYPAAEYSDSNVPELIKRQATKDGVDYSYVYFDDISKQYGASHWIEEPVIKKESWCLSEKSIADTIKRNVESEKDYSDLNAFPNLKDSVQWRVDENMRLLYDNAVTSPFAWDDLIASDKEIEVKNSTTLFFTPTDSIVGGKRGYTWTLYKFNGTENECVVKGKEKLVWTFTKRGNYDLVLELTDMNGNVSTLVKPGAIKVV